MYLFETLQARKQLNLKQTVRWLYSKIQVVTENLYDTQKN